MHIIPYSDAALVDCFTNNYTPSEYILKKWHYAYLKNYLGVSGLNSKTILVEDNYVSKDYLDDFTHYYVSCHTDYSKFCSRIHFFEQSFSEQEFKELLLTDHDTNSIWDSYLGFIVVKPIPSTVIGFTVLRTYSNSNSFDERNFWGTRKYKVHLFGKELSINSLAFQEQDSVLAACATTAIWSMLNKASLDFHTILKSPGLITKDAGEMASDGSRLFPNAGLNLLQICQAIYNSGLVSEIKQENYVLNATQNSPELKIVSNDYTKKIINAYSSIGIPIILVIHVPNGGQHGLHAITVSGFKKQSPSHIAPKQEISWLSSNIDKIYAHDDQWGPFARISFNNEFEIETPWSNSRGAYEPSYVSSIVVPLFPKIRISYETIESITLGLDLILTLFFNNSNVADLVWDIKLDFSENFKSFVKSSNLDNTCKLAFLEKGLPKYIWLATCYIGDNRIMDFSFDATNVKSAMLGLSVLSYINGDFNQQLSAYLQQYQSTLEPLMPYQSKPYYTFLINNLI
jgi:hypothetical protein